MPRQLPYTYERVTWRIRADDMELLRALQPNVNDFAATLINAYCERMRARLAGGNGIPQNHP